MKHLPPTLTQSAYETTVALWLAEDCPCCGGHKPARRIVCDGCEDWLTRQEAQQEPRQMDTMDLPHGWPGCHPTEAVWLEARG